MDKAPVKDKAKQYQPPDYDALQKRLDYGIAQHHKDYAEAMGDMDADHGKYVKRIAKLEAECDKLRDVVDGASGNITAPVRKAGRQYLKKQMLLHKLYGGKVLAFIKGTPMGHTPAATGDAIEDETDGDE